MDKTTNNDIKENSHGFTKTWMIEWTSNIGIRTHEEKDVYSFALDLFNKKSKRGEVMLYEIQKSTLNGSILKKIPVLNSKKAKKRREQAVKKIKEQSKKGKKISLSDNKFRIIILTSVIGALIAILLLINSSTNTGNVLSHHAVLYLFYLDRLFYSFEVSQTFF